MLDRDFGTYRLIRRLGRGGVADVYLARNTATGAEVALKLVEQKPDRESREICEAERRGAVLQQQFSLVDDHVPQVHGCWSIEEYFCIEMEYVDGEDLAERIARGAMTPGEAAWVAAEVCDFLRKAHVFEAVVDDTDLRGHHPRRHQAEERAAELGRPGEGAGLRHRQGAVAQPQADAERLRQPGVPVARSGWTAARSTSTSTSGRSASCCTRCWPARRRSRRTPIRSSRR